MATQKTGEQHSLLRTPEGLTEEWVYRENMDSLLMKGVGTEGTRLGVWP